MRTSWRFRPIAALPLALLLSVGFNITELTVTYLLRAIRCEDFSGSNGPGDHTCRAPSVVRAYSKDIAAYQTINTVFSILASGVYGNISDTRGRRHTMAYAGAFTASGNAWLGITAFYSPLRKPWSVLLSAAVKGCGGGLATMNAVHAAFVSDTSSTSTRSFYIGLLWIMYWIGAALSPMISAIFIERGLYVENCAIAVLTWTIYLAYVGFAVPETLPLAVKEPPTNSDAVDVDRRDRSNRQLSESQPRSQLLQLVHDVLSPVILICRHRVLRWLAATSFMMFIAVGASGFLVPYCDHKFGLTPRAAGMINAIMNVSRATAVLLFLPMFVTGYSYYITTRYPRLTPPGETEEEGPLLQDVDRGNSPHEFDRNDLSAAQELVISRIAFLMDAVGMLFTWKSQNATEVAISMAVGALGAPAGPSLQSLVTLAAPADQVGRALAGKSMLESTAAALRGPIYYAIYDATLEMMPGAIWLFTTAVYVVCSILLLVPRPQQFK